MCWAAAPRPHGYLCAAAYTHPSLRQAVRAREQDTCRARAPEVGLDIGAVTAACKRAERIFVVRNLLLFALFLPSAWLLFRLRSEDGGSILPLLICLVAAVAVVVANDFRIGSILRKLTRAAFYSSPPAPGQAEDPVNTVVYSGFSPFVGSGSDLGGWSFAVDLERGKPDAMSVAPRKFKIDELYGRVRTSFENLKIDHLRIYERLFVNGRTIREDRTFLPDIHRRPVAQVEDRVVSYYRGRSSKLVRHYLVIEVVDSSGEISVSIFLRLQKLSSKMFVEANTFLLSPLAETYRVIDRMHPELRFGDAFGLIFAGLIKGPVMLAISPALLLAGLSSALGSGKHESEARRAVNTDLLYDYGATRSLRESTAGTAWSAYFQKLDKEMHQKILQQQLIDTLIDFLDEKGVDTSELKERVMQVLNNGVIVSGGTINAQGLAVGAGAQATVSAGARQAREKAA